VSRPCTGIPDHCCGADCPCRGAGMTCEHPLGADEIGVCLESPIFPECWTDADCGDGRWCEGARVCPCGALCPFIDAPGRCSGADPCEGVPEGCCDEGCRCASATSDCVFPAGADARGVCKEAPPRGRCWHDADCRDGAVCEGARVCGCGVACVVPDEPGRCVEPDPCVDIPDGCCDDHCPCSDADAECVRPLGADAPGVCKAPPPRDQCWSDLDCEASEVCSGERVCPCGAMCLLPDAPGVCEAAGSGACCETGECAAGFTCLDATDPPTCHTRLRLPACWIDADCGAAGRCTGAVLCSCLMDCISRPGTCGH
jgi:hypothetical protein